MTYLPPLPENFKPKPKPPAEPPRRRVPHLETWTEYEAARARATNEPGPGGEAARQAALYFTREVMPDDILGAYLDDMRRGRR